MSKCKDLSGERFGRLIVVKRLENNKRGNAQWLCHCDCGNDTVVTTVNLCRGHVKSCGCLWGAPLIEKHSHGLRNHPLYPIWHAMVDRCLNERSSAYKYYGGRGITVCDEWSKVPTQFIEWAMLHGWKKGLEIDRVDNNGGYYPDNCRFVDRKTNQRNRRCAKKLGKWPSFRNIVEKIGVFVTPKSFSRLEYFIKKHGTLSDSLTRQEITLKE